MVRYRKEEYARWSDSERWELPYASIMNDNKQHSLIITLDGTQYANKFGFTAQTRAEFVRKLNHWFKVNKLFDYSAELVEPNTDLPASDTSDNKDEDGNYLNRIIINAKFTTNAWNTISISDIGAPTRAIGKHIKVVSYYKNNGFLSGGASFGGCCRAKYYDYINANQVAPTGPMASIDSVPNSSASWPLQRLPAKKADFEDISNSNCKILRDNFATYDNYLESWMVKFPCSAGGDITEYPSGKENTYKLANCTFLNNETGNREYLYAAAHKAAITGVDAPGLEAGNWWLPSIAEMVQMMRDITYGTQSWDTNPDIVNTVLDKLRSLDNKTWSMLSASGVSIFTPSRYNNDSTYIYYSNFGFMCNANFFSINAAVPITIYEF